jgi:hypothetical protein
MANLLFGGFPYLLLSQTVQSQEMKALAVKPVAAKVLAVKPVAA